MPDNNTPYPHIFDPVKLRHLTLRNRVVFGAHTANMSIGGLPGDKHLGYYRERARGGAAMIVVEPIPPHKTGVLLQENFRHGTDNVIPHFRRIADAVHAEGAAIVQQIYHVGGHGDQDNSWAPYWSPSGVPSYHDPWGSHAMTEAEIEELIDGFVEAARRIRDADFDGVDLFAGYNCLIDQFWSPLTNKRDDRWGGSLENRTRFAIEICEGIRRMAGDDFVIGMTISGAEPYPGGLTLEDKLEIVRTLDEGGHVDYFSVGFGSYLNQFSGIVPSFHFEMGLTRGTARDFKAACKQALVTTEARVKTPENADAAIAAGDADLVSIVRGQIADPHLVNKAREGRADDIRPCISCNQLCIGRRLKNYWISCLVNPSAGREFEWDGDRPAPTASPKNVLVIGGGPAGLEAARVAAERGHKVTIAEKTGELGGQFRLAAGQPERGEIGQLLNWYENQLEKLQVRIMRRTEMTADDIRAFGADTVVLGTGSAPTRSGFQRAFPHLDTLPGHDQDNVCTAHDVLDGTVVPGNRVLLLDDINGWWPASGTALHLAEQRHMVTLVTAADVPCGELATSQTADTTRERFWKIGVETVVSTALKSWDGNTATLINLYTGDKEEREFDTLVMALTNSPLDGLTRTLAHDDIDVRAIGDTVAPRTASMAIFEGRTLGLEL